MVLLEPDSFIAALHRLYSNTKKDGSVILSFKKYTGPPTRAKKSKGPFEKCCIVRAVAKKKKISTYVKAEDVVKFQDSLASVMKVNMDALKEEKKVKKKKKKKKVFKHTEAPHD